MVPLIWINIGLGNADWSFKEFCGIHLKAITLEMLMNQIHNMCLEITLLNLLPHLPGPMNDIECRYFHMFP